VDKLVALPACQSELLGSLIMLTPPTPEFIDLLMTEAIGYAKSAAKAGEVPVGAVIAHNNVIIGTGRNTTEEDQSVIAHAEIHAIQEASKKLGSWRLNECILCVTLEPCTMCLGAIRLARIPVIIFGAGDSAQGAVGSLYDLSLDDRLGSPPRVIRNIKAAECQALLKQFFSSLRA
jgi:tRNA(adenine34) deaminase